MFIVYLYPDYRDERLQRLASVTIRERNDSNSLWLFLGESPIAELQAIGMRELYVWLQHNIAMMFPTPLTASPNP